MIQRIVHCIFFLSLILSTQVFSQTNPVIDAFPKGTILHGNVAYNNDSLTKHLLDIYLPANTKGKLPLVILVHGGGWLGNDKYADIGYIKKTVAEIVSNDFALVSIDYRFSTQAVFPAQMKIAIVQCRFYTTMQINTKSIENELLSWAFQETHPL
jgi:acetyl esterase/lipase